MELEEVRFNLKDNYNMGTSVNVNSLLKSMLNFDFIVKIVITRYILDYTQSVTKILQDRHCEKSVQIWSFF